MILKRDWRIVSIPVELTVTVQWAINMVLERGYGGIGIWKADDGDIYEHFPSFIQFPARGWLTVPFDDDNRFPEAISYGALGGPKYNTSISQTAGGHEKRIGVWPVALCEYDVAHAIKTPAEFAELLAYFRAHKGKLYGFRFKDWSDYQAAGQVIGIGDDATLNFQLVKRYTVSALWEEVRTIYKPVAGTVKVYVDSVEQTETTDYTVDYSTGIVSFLSAPATDEEITADFEFDVPVRFDTDQMASSYESFQIHTWQSIPLVEIRDIS